MARELDLFPGVCSYSRVLLIHAVFEAHEPPSMIGDDTQLLAGIVQLYFTSGWLSSSAAWASSRDSFAAR